MRSKLTGNLLKGVRDKNLLLFIIWYCFKEVCKIGRGIRRKPVCGPLV